MVATLDHGPGQTVCPPESVHLKAAVEGVAGFRKGSAAVREIQIQAGEAEPVPTGTVTETGTACSVGRERGIEVREIYGAGDPD